MLKFYNSLSREKEKFVPHDREIVKMYSCGPTVYMRPHIGNMRAYLFMDNIRRVLKYNGYKIEGVMNITDVGHLTSDADEGEDKMLLASQREKKTPWDIAKYYTDCFMKDVKKLNVDLPEHICPATSVIEEIISFVKELLDKGFAYETSKGIYFDITKFADYGKLGMDVNSKKAGARIAVDDEKKHPADFALWIKAPKEHIMQWSSPWGMGYPGWHIECSAIGKKYLGDYIDIHTGGIDHKTIHHENEIAQSDCLEGHKVVHFWMHLEFLQIDGGKMSKSQNNILTIEDLENNGFSAEDFRFFYFNAHYSKQQNFTYDSLLASKNALKNFKLAVGEHKKSSEKLSQEKINEYEKEFLESINDDLNMPKALAVCQKLLKEKKSQDVYNLILKFNQILGLKFSEEEKDLPQEIKDLAEKRWQSKLDRDYQTADQLRQELLEKGYVIKDSKDGYEIQLKD